MKAIQKKTAELAAWIQLHLMDAHEKNAWIETTPEQLNYFRQFLKKPPIKASTPKPVEKPNPKPPEEKPPPMPSPTPPPPSPTPPPMSSQRAPDLKENPPPIEVATPQTTVYQKPLPLLLEAMKPAETQNFSQIKKVYHELFPKQPIVETLMDQAHLPDVLILYGKDEIQHESFLQSVAKAIPLLKRTAVILNISIPGQTESFLNQPLSLIVATEQTLQSIESFMAQYRANGNHWEGLPFIILSELSLYSKDPKLKAELWQKLKEKTSSRFS